MAAIPANSALAVRLGIIAVGVALGFGLRYVMPPTGDVIFDENRTGGARPAATQSPQPNEASQATESTEL